MLGFPRMPMIGEIKRVPGQDGEPYVYLRYGENGWVYGVEEESAKQQLEVQERLERARDRWSYVAVAAITIAFLIIVRSWQ